jgi:hypothetical protein
MATVVRRKCPSRDSELLHNPALLIQMKETAYRVANCLKTDNEAFRESFAKKLLISFIVVDEWKSKMHSIILKVTIGCLDTTKDGFEDIFEHYAWFCGYVVVWNKESVVIESRLGY